MRKLSCKVYNFILYRSPTYSCCPSQKKLLLTRLSSAFSQHTSIITTISWRSFYQGLDPLVSSFFYVLVIIFFSLFPFLLLLHFLHRSDHSSVISHFVLVIQGNLLFCRSSFTPITPYLQCPLLTFFFFFRTVSVDVCLMLYFFRALYSQIALFATSSVSLDTLMPSKVWFEASCHCIEFGCNMMVSKDTSIWFSLHVGTEASFYCIDFLFAFNNKI